VVALLNFHTEYGDAFSYNLTQALKACNSFQRFSEKQQDFLNISAPTEEKMDLKHDRQKHSTLIQRGDAILTMKN
jgi:hypothetical protein